MSDNKFVNRIPFEEIETIKSWDIPAVGSGGDTSSDRGKKRSQQGAAVESIEEVRPEDLKAVTAEQLQNVTLEAEKEGREKGYQDGLKQGFSDGEKQGAKNGEKKAYADTRVLLDEKTQAFKNMADALLDPVSMQDGELENVILDMAVHFTKHLLDRELSEDPSSLFKIVERAVNTLPTGAKNIRIYLHADDAELAHEAFEGSGRNWVFHVDSSLTRGGCRVESDQSLIDFSIEHRLKAMLEKVDFQGEVEPSEMTEIEDYQPSVEANKEELLPSPEGVPPSLNIDETGEDEDEINE